MPVVVARIGRPHGLRGEVTVEVRTDDPAQRLAPGARFEADPASAGPLTVQGARTHHGVTVLAFEGVERREDAEALRGTLLVQDASLDDEGEAFYEDQLVGLRVRRTDGTPIGTIAELATRPAQDLLLVDLDAGGQAMVPFVTALVPTVDIAGGYVVIDPPAGLLDLEST